MSDKKADKKADKKKGDKKAKKSKKAAGADGDASLPSIANHPRALAQVARAKSWGGLGGFALGAYLSYKAGVPMSVVLLRSLLGGFAGYVLVWAAAVALWRHLVIAELRAVRAQRRR
jgi:hypothetical protein